MFQIEHFVQAFFATFHFQLLILNFTGVIIGIIVGAIPGLTATMAVATAIPFTFGAEPVTGLVFLIGIYTGGITGGLISATLLRVPGTPSSIATLFDGYPMAKNGQPGRALGIATISSFIGGMFSAFCLIFISPPLANIALKMGPFEYFSLIIMALVMIASLIKGSTIKGLIVAVVGLLFGTVGMAPLGGTVRFSFGFNALEGGFSLIPVLIGLFAIPEIMRDIEKIRMPLEKIPTRLANVFPKLKELNQWKGNFLRSSITGTWIGLLPGIGGAAAGIIAYGQAKQASKHPEKFGTGIPEGIVASETANNATVGGALIPLFTMGIPGSAVDAVLLGGLMIHNLQPGPLLFQNHPDVVYTCFVSFVLSNLFLPIILFGGIRGIIKTLDIPKHIIHPAILIFCVVGTFACNNRMFDVWSLIVFGLIGYFFEKYGYNLQPFILGIMLGPIAEKELRVGLMASDGSFLPIIARPFSALFLAIAIVSLVLPYFMSRRQKKRTLGDRL